MAVGNLIYCGKSRLRRKFRKQKLEKKANPSGGRRSPSRGSQESLNRPSTKNYQSLPLHDHNADQRNFQVLLDGENHSCRYCKSSFHDLERSSSSSSSDLEDLIPLIDHLPLRPTHTFTMPFFGKKKDEEKKKEEAKKEEPTKEEPKAEPKKEEPKEPEKREEEPAKPVEPEETKNNDSPADSGVEMNNDKSEAKTVSGGLGEPQFDGPAKDVKAADTKTEAASDDPPKKRVDEDQPGMLCCTIL